MATRQGILLSTDDTDYNDLLVDVVKDLNGLITSGLVIGESDNQNADIIIQSKKGEIKEYPVLGAHLVRFVNSTNRDREMIREITVNLNVDGYKPTITIATDGTLKING